MHGCKRGIAGARARRVARSAGREAGAAPRQPPAQGRGRLRLAAPAGPAARAQLLRRGCRLSCAQDLRYYRPLAQLLAAAHAGAQYATLTEVAATSGTWAPMGGAGSNAAAGADSPGGGGAANDGDGGDHGGGDGGEAALHSSLSLLFGAQPGDEPEAAGDEEEPGNAAAGDADGHMWLYLNHLTWCRGWAGVQGALAWVSRPGAWDTCMLGGARVPARPHNRAAGAALST